MGHKPGLIKHSSMKRKGVGTDACKMRKMLFVVECQYISEDTKVRLYLSQVREVRNPVARLLQKKAAAAIARLVLSGALTAPFAAWSIIYAFLERGYKAYGGEYLFIIMVFLAMHWALGKLMDDGNMDIF